MAATRLVFHAAKFAADTYLGTDAIEYTVLKAKRFKSADAARRAGKRAAYGNWDSREIQVVSVSITIIERRA